MFKSFLQGFFKPTPAESTRVIPAPTPPDEHSTFRNHATATMDVQKAIIESLTAHIAKLDGPITTVRIPHFAIEHDGARYRTASSDFEVIRGLDPFGDNVAVKDATPRPPAPTMPPELQANTTSNSISYSYGGIATATVGQAK